MKKSFGPNTTTRRKGKSIRSEGIQVIQGHNSHTGPEVDGEQRGIEEVISHMKRFSFKFIFVGAGCEGSIVQRCFRTQNHV